MAFKYQFDKEDGSPLGCDVCSEEVPLASYDDMIKGKIWLCTFCAHSVGRAHDTVTKQMMSQYFNTLVKELRKNAKRSDRKSR